MLTIFGSREKSSFCDGLGRRDSIPARLARATDIVLVDMPLWIHFWLAAERQMAWSSGAFAHPAAGMEQMPSTEALFRTIAEVDRDWMPEIRKLVALEEKRGKKAVRIGSVAELVSKLRTEAKVI